MNKKRKLIALLLALVLMLTGCATAPQGKAPAATATTAAARPLYALVVKDTTNPYMQYMGQGFADACTELNAVSRVCGPDNSDSMEQARVVEELIDAGVSAIAIAVNDANALAPALSRALESGIPVVSVDSCADPADRQLHIQQASPETVGRVLVQAAYEMVGGHGRGAILSTTESMPNQALWVEWMLAELEEHRDKYADFTLDTIVYGNDEYDASARAMRTLLTGDPVPDIVIAPTVVGLKAAADVVRESGASVLVTGLGLPGDMAPYIRSGVCPWMYLWNPIDMGYITAYAAAALDGGATGAVEEIINVGSFGQKIVKSAADGGSEIVVGNPYQFDGSNIAIWEKLF